MSKIPTDTIKTELAQLETTEAIAAPYYLKRELNRRNASKRNPGRPRKYDDDKHIKDRERKRK